MKTVRATWLGACVVIGGAASLAGCSTTPVPKTAAGLDAAYGIPPGSVPSELQRPDGMLINGLLPAQPDDGS